MFSILWRSIDGLVGMRHFELSSSGCRAPCRDPQELSRTSLNHNAARGGRTATQRANNLAVIASACNREEFAGEKGIGDVRVVEVESWLVGLGLEFRGSSVDACC